MEWILTPVRKLYPAIAGRSRRGEFWSFFGFNFLLFCVFFGLIIAVGDATGGASGGAGAAFGGVLVLIFVLMIPLMIWMYVAFPAMIAVMCRRFHDQDRSAWFMLIGIIPYLGWLILLIFMCIDGTAGPNRYGADPKAPSDEQVFA